MDVRKLWTLISDIKNIDFIPNYDLSLRVKIKNNSCIK